MKSPTIASPFCRMWAACLRSQAGRALFWTVLLLLGSSSWLQAQTPVKVNFESGVISLPAGQANSTTWQTATFTRNFNGLVPVVIMGPVHSADAHPHTVRARNVTATGFQWQIDEWDYLDGAHTGAIT